MGERTMWPSGTASSTGAAATGAAAGAGACIIWGACIIIGAPIMLLAMRTFSSPSVIYSSAMPEASTRSMSFFSFLRSMGSPVLEVVQRVFQRQFVTVRAQTGHHADGEGGKIRVMAEGFARVNVGKMNFDEREGGGGQRIPRLAATQQIEVGAVQNQHVRVQTGDRFDRCAAGSFSRHGGEFAVKEGKLSRS